MTLRILAGATTGCLAVLVAQPTDVVKIRMQADMSSRGARRYTGSISAYRNIGKHEGIKGLWKGTFAAYVYLLVAHRAFLPQNCYKHMGSDMPETVVCLTFYRYISFRHLSEHRQNDGR